MLVHKLDGKEIRETDLQFNSHELTTRMQSPLHGCACTHESTRSPGTQELLVSDATESLNPFMSWRSGSAAPRVSVLTQRQNQQQERGYSRERPILSSSVLTWPRVISFSDVQPLSAMAISSSSLSICSTFRTPASPSTASENSTGRPICSTKQRRQTSG